MQEGGNQIPCAADYLSSPQVSPLSQYTFEVKLKRAGYKN